jgi:pimeloyl-ACP methyl ester carboxylesterase
VRSKKTSEELWRDMLTGEVPGLQRTRRFMLHIPSEPRCKPCAAPFGRPGPHVPEVPRLRPLTAQPSSLRRVHPHASEDPWNRDASANGDSLEATGEKVGTCPTDGDAAVDADFARALRKRLQGGSPRAGSWRRRYRESRSARTLQIITGDHDPGVLPVNGDYLHERLPHSKPDRVDAGHFAWADAADEYASLIIDWWWNGGYERV